MIRLLTLFGSKIHDEDVLIVVDRIEEVGEAISKLVLTKGEVDLHILTTELFMKLLYEDPFYVNVLINGSHIVNTFSVTEGMRKNAIEKAREIMTRMCKEGYNGISLGYNYLISQGIFPKNRHDVRRLLGKDKGDDFSFICHKL